MIDLVALRRLFAPVRGMSCDGDENLRAAGLAACDEIGRLRRALEALTVEADTMRIVISEYALESAELDAIRAALGNGADEDLWPPGMTLAQCVALAVGNQRAAARLMRAMGGGE